MKFRKMHGLGNDFVVFDRRGNGLRLTRDQILKIADRRHGIGCDQVIVIEGKKSPDSSVFMRIFNSDGSEAEACGNATRCVADLILRENTQDSCVIETIAGSMACKRAGMNRICVAMTRPRFGWTDIPLARECDTLHLPLPGDPAAVSMGNPHCVFFVNDIENAPVETLGPEIEKNPFFPDGTNVEFVQILNPVKLRIRVWERGAGVTPACGSGACATLAAAVRRGLCARKVETILDGGSLTLEWAADDAPVLMTGPVAYVFDGEINFDYLSNS